MQRPREERGFAERRLVRFSRTTEKAKAHFVSRVKARRLADKVARAMARFRA
jgi:hypothetical protein